MVTITLTPLLKCLIALILSILYLINGSNLDQHWQTYLQKQNTTKLEHILKHPEELKGCKL